MIFSYLLNMQSHPSWVCGLKRENIQYYFVPFQSHPSWVCGLKPSKEWSAIALRCHTLRGCVD